MSVFYLSRLRTAHFLQTHELNRYLRKQQADFARRGKILQSFLLQEIVRIL